MTDLAQEAASQDEEALHAQLSQARTKLDGLVGDLRGIDVELDDQSAERRQYRLLAEVCAGLDELRELGGSRLFWGEHSPDGQGDDHLRLVWGRADAFEKRLGEIEARRQAVVEEIEHAQQDAELLEDDLFELKVQAEQRKQEWLIEREVDGFAFRASVMPWARGGEDDQRFRKALAAALLLSLLFGLLLPLIDLPLPEPWEATEVPERFTRLIREEPPPPAPVPAPQEAKLQEKEPEQPVETRTAEPTPKKVASKGILAFREKFSALAESKPSARLGANARIRRAGETARGRSQRSLVTTQAGSSGGIDIGALSRDVGNGGEGQIEGVEVARATSSIGGAGEDRPLSDGPGLSRTDEEIQIVFDRHKAGLYRLYNRELRRDPTLKGQMVLRITILPDGTVSLCEVQSSDMKAPQLSAQIVGRVETFDFGAKEGIPAITILYPIDFLPAT